ncbi:MAG: filamentous hemagglutinin N-terminal domain-containing protein [Leptolyngbyaceae bacterium]|nr:filamentous hemagglutinin N-terminal domain-containing protein [Leptolyngbyaceae bacterium]
MVFRLLRYDSTSSRYWRVQIVGYLPILVGWMGISWVGISEGAIAPAAAQLIPDQTLGAESSVVRPERIRNRDGHRIEGGAIRGENLFHSFLEFNIDEGRGAYFSTPSGIENILGRVTGDDVSDILGELGVLGEANLFLLNPNGFLFGENATLDIRGSFVASTADRFAFPDGSEFSAVTPAAAPLLTVALSPGLQYGTNYQGAIANAATLSVDPGETLSLAGITTTSTGSLIAPGGTIQVLGNHVTLLGDADVDVSSERGGGTIFVGGNLGGVGSLPNAQHTIVGSGVALRADARTTGQGGTIVVWANGLTQFYGSLSARGGIQSGNGGFAEVSGKETLVFDGQANLTAPRGLLGTLLLDPANIIIVDGEGGRNDAALITDGEILAEENPGETFTISEETLEGIMGNVVLEATNDITVNDLSDNELAFSSGDGTLTFRADADNDGAGDFRMLDRTDALSTAGRNITITGVDITAGLLTSAGGTVRLTGTGDITSGTITSESGNVVLSAGGVLTPGSINSQGGTIALSAGDRVVLNNVDINSGDFEGISFTGFSGDINISAENDIILTNATVTSDGSGFAGSGNDDAGDIRFRTVNGSIRIGNESEISSSAAGSGFAGDITFRSGDRLTIRNSRLLSDANNDTGDTFDGAGGAGFITLRAESDVAIANSRINAESSGGDAQSTSGNITITSRQGRLRLNTVELITDTFVSGIAGDIDLLARDNVSIRGSTISATSVNGPSPDDDAGDDVGFLSIRSSQGSIILRNGTQLSTNVEDSGLAGTMILQAGDAVAIRQSTLSSDFDNVGDDVFTGDSGGAGEIEVSATNDVAIANGIISASSFNGTNTDEPGNIVIQSNQGSLIIRRNSEVTTDVASNGFAGSIFLDTPQGTIDIRDSIITSSLAEGTIFGSSAEGGAGSIDINAFETVFIGNSTVSSEGGFGTVFIGDSIAPESIEIADDSLISTTNIGNETQDAGEINVTSGELIFINGSTITSSAVDAAGVAVAGDRPPSIQAQATADAFGNGGDILLQLRSESGLVVLQNASQILTDAGAVPSGSTGGNGGNIEIVANVIAAELLGNNDITANSVNNNGGTITITAPGGIFGLIPRTREDLVALLGTEVESDLDPRLIPTSDITAISQTGAGLNGEVVLNTPDVDPSRGNIELPSAFEETPTLATVCSARLDAEAGQRSEFVFTGRGGFPSDPDDPIDGSRPSTPWVERIVPDPGDANGTNETPFPPQSSIKQDSLEQNRIVEAQGWVTNAQGQTILTASGDRPIDSTEPRTLTPTCVSHSDISETNA